MNYTQAADFVRAQDVDVFAQLVVRPDAGDPDRLSVACNADVPLDLLDPLRWRGGGRLLVGQANSGLPFMPRPTAPPTDAFDYLLECEGIDFAPFAPPAPKVSDADHAIGLRAAAMVEDGGTLPIGIGSIGDALGSALPMRERAPELFAETPACRSTLARERGWRRISTLFSRPCCAGAGRERAPLVGHVPIS